MSFRNTKSLKGQDQRCRVDGVRFATEILVGQPLQSSRNELELVPNALRNDQLAQRADLSISLLSKIKEDKSDFMERIITGDES